MKPLPSDRLPSTHVWDEEIDVARIRLSNSNGSTAVLSDFHRTEQVLSKWAQSGNSDTVRFEVCFVDGYVLKGGHEFFKKGKRKHTFSTHLRSLLKIIAGSEDFSRLFPSGKVSRYSVPTN
jgi:hypothetical protein